MAKTKKPMIWTVGYKGMKPERLEQILRALDASLVDVRYNPVSRNANYRKSALVARFGDSYQTQGHHLGGRGNTTPSGIEFLRNRSTNMLLLCMCHAPGECHRHMFICSEHFPDALHIYDDEIVTAGELERSMRDDDDYEVSGSLADLLAGRAKPLDFLP